MASHILVIDDQINLPRFIAMELQSEGYQVSLYCNDEEELTTIQELNPDLIVLNWELRRKSGLNIYRQLRSVDHQVPIVVITAEDDRSCRLALDLGVQTCLTKPFSMHDLIRAIEYHLMHEKQSAEYSICN